MRLKAKIYTTTKRFDEDLSFIKRSVEQAKNVSIDFEVSYVRFDENTPVFKDTDGGVKPDWGYLKDNLFENEYNVVCWHITRKECDQLGLTHPNPKYKLGGSYHYEHDDTLDFVVIANKSQQADGYDFSEFVRIFLHELAHGFETWTLGKPNFNVHHWDYDLKEIHNIYQIYDLNRYNIRTRMEQTLRQIINLLKGQMSVLETALSYIGTDASPADLAPDELGCAESLSNILKKVDPSFPIVTGTYTLWDVLENSDKYRRVTIPMPGTIIICPTVPNKPFPGHAGIFGRNFSIMSNDSSTGKWMANYSWQTWKERYEVKGGYKSYMYQKI